MVPHAASSVSHGAGINPQTTVHIQWPLWPFLYTPIWGWQFLFLYESLYCFLWFCKKPLNFLFMWVQRLAVFTWNNNSDARLLILETSAVGWREKLFLYVTRAPSGSGPPYYRGFTITLRHITLGRTPLDAETSTWQHTTLTTDRYPCPRYDSNPQSQQARGRRHTP